MAEIIIKMSEEAAKNLLAKADSIKYLLELNSDTSEGWVLKIFVAKFASRSKKQAQLNQLVCLSRKLKK